MADLNAKWPPRTEGDVLAFFGSDAFQQDFRKSVSFLARSSLCARHLDLVDDAAMQVLAEFLEKGKRPNVDIFLKFKCAEEFNRYFFKCCHNQLVDDIRRRSHAQQKLMNWFKEGFVETASESLADEEIVSARDKLVQFIHGPYSREVADATGLTEREHTVLSYYLSAESVAQVGITGGKEAAVRLVTGKMGLGRRTVYRILESAKSKIQSRLRHIN